jgi:hypothetical protein
MRSTRISRRVDAPRAAFYRALLDARAVHGRFVKLVTNEQVTEADNEAG